ncbi:MAG: hypothetical protein QM756_02860 [Polyangiaceae bacterium]
MDGTVRCEQHANRVERNAGSVHHAHGVKRRLGLVSRRISNQGNRGARGIKDALTGNCRAKLEVGGVELREGDSGSSISRNARDRPEAERVGEPFAHTAVRQFNAKAPIRNRSPILILQFERNEGGLSLRLVGRRQIVEQLGWGNPIVAERTERSRAFDEQPTKLD